MMIGPGKEHADDAVHRALVDPGMGFYNLHNGPGGKKQMKKPRGSNLATAGSISRIVHE